MATKKIHFLIKHSTSVTFYIRILKDRNRLHTEMDAEGSKYLTSQIEFLFRRISLLFGFFVPESIDEEMKC